MNKSKIEWCDMTWNPVTGCLHNCPYCYARKIATRFGWNVKTEPETEVLNYACGNEKRINPYPFGFKPTFHRYRLGEPTQIKKPQRVFVCSMADLFGDWVPDEWINEVFDACKAAPRHTYLFLTKNPKRYRILQSQGILPYEFLYGTTFATGEYFSHSDYRTFISVEPIFNYVEFDKRPQQVLPDWVIVGAETGNRKGRVVPKEAWINNIVLKCERDNIPVFMKDSLLPIMGEENMKREYPTILGGNL